MSNVNYEIIDKYLAGELKGEELESFEKELQQNEVLANEVALYKAIENDLTLNHKHKDDKDTLLANLDVLSKQYFSSSSAKVISFKKSWFLAAASIAAILILVFIILPKKEVSNQELFAENINKNIELLSPTIRGKNDSLQIKSSLLYNNKSYTDAIPFLKKTIEADSSGIDMQIALSFSYIQTNQYNLALDILNKVSYGNSVYIDKAKWYKALIYLKENKTNECIGLLKQIPNNYDNYNSVVDLLKKLEH